MAAPTIPNQPVISPNPTITPANGNAYEEFWACVEDDLHKNSTKPAQAQPGSPASTPGAAYDEVLNH
jgi:hypothetical protein